MFTKEMLSALMAAQEALEAAEREYRVAVAASIYMVPSSVSDERLNAWRSEETSPAEQKLQAALTERDHLLAPTGLSVEAWQQKLAAARAKTSVTV
jgi:hypothetical protein